VNASVSDAAANTVRVFAAGRFDGMQAFNKIATRAVI
jgi:hypothetical protein